jgi:sugar lactone lactonase YvrE
VLAVCSQPAPVAPPHLCVRGDHAANLLLRRRVLRCAALLVVALAGIGSLDAQISPYPYERYRFTTLAGAPPGSSDGGGQAARFNQPRKIAIDHSGNLFVADTGNSTIRKITPDGATSTFAGFPSATGSSDGRRELARFNRPAGIAVDSQGNVYVADAGNHTIRKITPDGVVTTLAGLAGTFGIVDGHGAAARFNNLGGLAVDTGGNVYVTDGETPSNANDPIRKISPTGDVTTVASGLVFPSDVAVDGNSTLFATVFNRVVKITPQGLVSTFAGDGSYGTTDGVGTDAKFNNPSGLGIDSSGNLYVTDTGSHTIRKITPNQLVTTVAGVSLQPGSDDGPALSAKFRNPAGVAAGPNGEVYIADTFNNEIRTIASQSVATLAGRAPIGSADGSRFSAQFYHPSGEAFDTSGNLYVADGGNNTIRKITTQGDVSTFAGSAGVAGSSDGIGSAARFNNPVGIAFDAAGNLYVADSGNHIIRKITPAGLVSTIAGLAGNNGTADGFRSNARFAFPSGVAIDSAGSVYVADSYNHTIRKITSAGNVTTFAGTPNPGAPGSLVDGKGSAASFSYVYSIAIDSDGVLWVADRGNVAIRKITPDATVSTFARLSNYALALDGSGHIYVADDYNSAIRKIDRAGVITTLGGWGPANFAEGAGSAALFSSPSGIAVDGQGKVYVADTGNNAIRVGGPEVIPQSLNISTRLAVGSGDRVMICGFILTGHYATKKVILRAIGPSLAASGVTNALSDPQLELHDATGATIATNHNWRVADDGNPNASNDIVATGIPPSDDRESAIVKAVPVGNPPNSGFSQSYTSILSGENNATGVALVEVYDLNPTTDALLANISTRGFVGSGPEVMIGGFILGGGNGTSQIVVRAIGPSLTAAGITHPLRDPVLEVHDRDGNLIAANDDWKTSQSAIEATGLAPGDDAESAVVLTLSSGNYTAIVRGKNGSAGVALVEVYNLQ